MLLRASIKRRVWEERPALAQHRNAAGQLVADGRMMSPQDQRVAGYDRDFEVVVVPGAQIPCEVEGANDLDTLVQVNGQEAEHGDTVNYTWRAQGDVEGEWRWQELENGVMVTKEGSSAPVSRATWIAPSDIDHLWGHNTKFFKISREKLGTQTYFAVESSPEIGLYSCSPLQATSGLNPEERIVSSTKNPLRRRNDSSHVHRLVFAKSKYTLA